MTYDRSGLTKDPANGRRLLAVAAVVLAIAGFLICMQFGHWAREPDPSIGRTFPIPGRRGLSYVTAPGFVGVLLCLGSILYLSFNWRSLWAPVRETRYADADDA